MLFVLEPEVGTLHLGHGVMCLGSPPSVVYITDVHICQSNVEYVCPLLCMFTLHMDNSTQSDYAIGTNMLFLQHLSNLSCLLSDAPILLQK